MLTLSLLSNFSSKKKIFTHRKKSILEKFLPSARDGMDNKYCIHMLCCVCKSCQHAARHRIQTQLTSHYTAPHCKLSSRLFFKFPLSEKNYLSSSQHTKKLTFGVSFWRVFRGVALSDHVKLLVF